jgi:hypothetical protein
MFAMAQGPSPGDRTDNLCPAEEPIEAMVRRGVEAATIRVDLLADTVDYAALAILSSASVSNSVGVVCGNTAHHHAALRW